MDRAGVERWVDGYERAWRSAGTDGLAALFAPDATYLVEPWAAPVVGLAAIAGLWEAGREGPDEVFALVGREVVAVDGDVAVVRLEVRYGEPARQAYRDLWVLRFGPDGRCTSFEEWPTWPGKGTTPATG